MQNKTGHNDAILFLNTGSCDLKLEGFKVQDVSESIIPVCLKDTERGGGRSMYMY